MPRRLLNDVNDTRQIYRRVSWRLLPLLTLLYFAAYLDRVNVAFAKLQMSADLGITDASFGLGAGIFFIGYLAFQLPSNYLLVRLGARRWIGSICIAWGIASCAMSLMSRTTEFYSLRFLLGLAEAGYFPAVVWFLSRWYPQRYRAWAMAVVLSSVQLAGIVGGPLSGQVLERLSGTLGLRGWQWLFILEGIVPVLLGLVAYRALADSPASAPWLTGPQREVIRAEVVLPVKSSNRRFIEAFANVRTYTLGLGYFSVICALYVLIFWTPTLIADAGVARIGTVGNLSAIPALGAIVSMLGVGRIADRTAQPTKWTVISAVAGAVGLCTIPIVGDSLLWLLAALCLANAGLSSATSCFWAIPRPFASQSESAGGIAVINTLGALGGFVGPTFTGLTTRGAGKVDVGLYVASATLLIGSLLLVVSSAALQRRSW